MRIPLLLVLVSSCISGALGYALKTETGPKVVKPTHAKDAPTVVPPPRWTAPRGQKLADAPSPNAATMAATATRASTDEGEPSGSRVSDNLHDYQEYLGVVFDSEGRDRAWETVAEGRLRDGVLKLEALGARIQTLECRATLCKVVLAGPDAATLDALKAQFLDNVSWHGPGMLASVPPTHPTDFRVVAFLGREGRELPDG
jgi:hypothetical protein